MSSSRMDHGWLKWTMFLSCWLRVIRSVSASEFNITVDSTDSSVFYLPQEVWHTSGRPCPVGVTGRATVFDLSSSWLRRNDRTSRSSKSSPGRASCVSAASDRLGRAVDDHGGKGALSSESKFGFLKREAAANGEAVEHKGMDRTDEAMEPSIRFDFTGTAIYVYGSLVSVRHLEATQTPSFSVDGIAGTEALRSAESPTMLFAQRGLANGPHSLKVTLIDNTGFSLDYLKYTSSPSNPNFLHARQEPSASVTDPSVSSVTASAPSSSSPPQPNKKRNITTFAAAVGGSVGVLALLSLGLAISIIRRRRVAAKRERLEREDPEYLLRQQQQLGMAQTGSNDVVFIPRYFPGTEIPPQPSALPPGDSPPPYTPPVAPPNVANHHDLATRGTGRAAANTVAQNPAFTYALPPFHPPMRSPYLHHPPPRPSDSPELTYADIPPDSPPPPPPPELPLPSLSSPASPVRPVLDQRRPTHVSVGVGNEDQDGEHDPALPPGIGAPPQRAVSRAQSSSTGTEHVPPGHSGSNDNDDDLSHSGHSLEHVGAIAGRESLPLLASPAEAHQNSAPRRDQSIHR